jgi:hypothetical protein
MALKKRLLTMRFPSRGRPHRLNRRPELLLFDKKRRSEASDARLSLPDLPKK